MRKLDVINAELNRLHDDYDQLLDRIIDAPSSLTDTLNSQLTVITVHMSDLYNILENAEDDAEGSDIPDDMYATSIDD
jgi:uncharacterized protein YdcH (DUF465 family)